MDEQTKMELGQEAQSLECENQREQMLSEAQEGIKQLQTENKRLKDEMDKWNLSAKNIEEDLTFEAENKRLKEAIEGFGKNPAGFDWAVLERIEQLETELVCANELCGGYEAELAKHRWIPVSERLPYRNAQVLLTAKAAQVFVGHFSSIKNNYVDNTGEILCSEVTHWKPIILPEQISKDKQ